MDVQAAQENLSAMVAPPGEPLEYRFLQPVWDLRVGYEDYVSSPLFPVVYSILFYFLSVLPWMLIDLFGQNWKLIQRYKIQSDKEVTWPLVRKAIALTAWNHVIYILPLSIFQWVNVPPAVLPPLAPTVWEVTWQNMACLAIFDLEYFLWHSFHHKVRFLYRHVHSVHHQYSSPSSWVTQYLHPWELISVGIFSTTSPWLVGCHMMTELVFQQFAILVSVDSHIGYDLPFLPHNWFPFWAGSIHHDMHHQKPLTNFSPFFTYWDRLIGSFCPSQRAGGYKPKELIEWEEVDRKARDARLRAKGLKSD